MIQKISWLKKDLIKSLCFRFDLKNTNVNDDNLEKMAVDKIPDVVLVKKVYAEKSLRVRRRYVHAEIFKPGHDMIIYSFIHFSFTENGNWNVLTKSIKKLAVLPAITMNMAIFWMIWRKTPNWDNISMFTKIPVKLLLTKAKRMTKFRKLL